MILRELFSEETFFPQLRGTQWVQNYMTSEYCDICEAELERKFQEDEAQGGRARQRPAG